MLVAVTKPHQQFPVSLFSAEYELTTSIDGDERGRITLPPALARSGVMTQIGDELIIYCTQLSKTIWRGQIERIEEAQDGSITWYALGFGALQREARISVVQEMSDMTRWRPVGAGMMAGSGFDSRNDLWEYELVSYAGALCIRIRTKKAFTITNTTLFFLVYLYDQPERYATITTTERLTINPVNSTGLADGVWVAPVIAIPPSNGTALTIGMSSPVTALSTVSVPFCYGWVFGVRASGSEVIAGTTSVTVYAVVNLGDSNGIDDTLLSAALLARGGCCDVRLPSQTTIHIEKPDANLREIIEQSGDDYVRVRYQYKRFFRDRAKPTISFASGSPFVLPSGNPFVFTADSPFTWRFPDTTRFIDISKAPSRVFAQYRGYEIDHLTTSASVATLESRRQLAQRTANVGEYSNQTTAETQRNEATIAFERQIAPLSIDLDNTQYELMTTSGITIPNWTADVGDYAIVPGYFRNAKITSRTITHDRTMYTVSFDFDDFVTALGG